MYILNFFNCIKMLPTSKKIFHFQPLQTANFDKGLKPFFYIKRQTKTIIIDKNKGINISSN